MNAATIVEISADAELTPTVDIDALKGFHRAFPTGVTIVTSLNSDGEPVGLAVNAFSSVTMDPPMVLVCVNQRSQSHDSLSSSEYIGVSVLAHDQSDVAMLFAKSGGDKFATLDWDPAAEGSPHIRGAAATLEMKVVQKVAAGTHTVFFGLITSAAAGEKAPLVYHDAKFFDGSALNEVQSSAN